MVKYFEQNLSIYYSQFIELVVIQINSHQK